MAYLPFGSGSRRIGVCLRYVNSINSLIVQRKNIGAYDNSVSFHLQISANDVKLFKPYSVRCLVTQGTEKSEFHNNYTMQQPRNSSAFSSLTISKNITLYTSETITNAVNSQTLQLKIQQRKPVILLLAWLMAKPRHLRKYITFWTQIGFDVVVVHISPWQLLWPTKGAHVVAAETIKFLNNNTCFEPIVVHGFSVGAYQFGEIMLQMARDMNRYSDLLNRIGCQIWDSPADITEIPVGLPKAIFPRNHHMQNVLRNYTLYHLKTFHNQATIHYIRSSQMFHSTIVKKPALFLVSDNDLIGPPSSSKTVADNWERSNISVTLHSWKHSVHAAHFLKHHDDYVELLFKHLEKSGVLQTPVPCFLLIFV